MSTRYIRCTAYLTLILLYSCFIFQCILTEECHPDDDACETYLAIYLQTAKHNAFPASLFESDFIKFAAAFNAMCNEVCEYEYMAYPSFYYIRIDSSSDTDHQYTFAIHLLCDKNNAQSISCCNDFYDNYLNRPSYGILVETWLKHVNKGTMWQNIDIEGRTVDYFWDYKYKNSTFEAPTSSPTLSPLQYAIDCQYTPQYLSIICYLNPSYKTYKVSNNNNGLTMYERSSSLCTKLFDTRSQSLELLGFECDDCTSAQCQLKNVSYDDETHEIEIWSIQIFLTVDCTISVDDSIRICITLEDDICEHVSSGVVKESSNDIYHNVDTSITVFSPYYVSSQCMVYTIYDDIQSNIESIHWSTNDDHNHFNPCLQNNCCTFSTMNTGNTSVSMMEQTTTVSVETAWGLQHNISTKVQYQDNVAFIPLIFYSPHYVSFKPIYFIMDIIISCDHDLINLNIYDWIDDIDGDISIFSTKWSMRHSNDDTSEFSDRNLFVNPDQESLNENELIASLSLSAQNLQILSSINVLTSITNTLVLTRIYGNIKAIISNGMYQYYPSQLNGNSILISLKGNEYSFDQETEIDSSLWQYKWTCEIVQHSTLCPIQIENDNDEAILQFTSDILQQDIVYLFTLQIVDPMNERMDETFTMLTISPSVINLIVAVNIEWDNSLYYVPSYHGSTNISVSIDDGTHDDILWLYTFCFVPSLEDGVSCASFESMNRSLIYSIEPFNTLSNHQYIVDIDISSLQSEYMHHGMVSTILEISAVSHINDFSISSDYHSYDKLSSDLYQSLYQDSNSFIQFVDCYLLSMKTNCVNPPCTYSYFYQITNPNKEENMDIPFYFAVGNGLSFSPLSGVILPWNYDDLNILGCIEDIDGSITCALIELTVSLKEHSISDEICDYYMNITNHLLLLRKMEDKLSLAQFMTALIFEIVDAEYDDDECVESMIDLMLYYINDYLIPDEYFIYYPFQILQILYLTSENNLIGPNAYKHFIQIYEIMFDTHKVEKYYFPYSDHDYIEWDTSFVLSTVSYYYSVVSLIDDVDLECSSLQSVLQDDIYDIIHDISDVITALLSHDSDEIIQHISDVIYVYARRFEFDLDAQKYRAFALNEMYSDDTFNTQNILETLSISDSNIEAGSIIELKLLSFNPFYITSECFGDYNAESVNETKIIYVSMSSVQDIESKNEYMTLVFSWKISNATIEKLLISSGFNIYCESSDDSHCSSSDDLSRLWSLQYFECSCFGVINGGSIYGLVIDISGDASLMIKQERATQHQVIALDRTEWIIFLSLFLFLLCFGYMIPLCFVYKMKCEMQLFWVFYFYASIVFGNFLMQIYLCYIAFVSNNVVWLWQIEVIYGLECASLGVFNVFLVIIMNDRKCNKFPILTPLMTSVSNAFLTAFIIIFTIVHGILINHINDYGSSSWSLWMVYFGFICLTILFIVYLSYYWYKGKNFSGGKPYQYTEGKRESTAIVIMIAAIVLYCLCAINGYIVYALSNNNSIHHYMRSFQCLHWISLFILALIIFIVERFERNEHKHITSSITIPNEINHHIIPNTDDSEDDVIPAPDGTVLTVNSININSIDNKPSNTMVLLGSSINTTENIKQSLIRHQSTTGNDFSSTSDFENEEKQIKYCNINASSVPGFIPNSRTMNETQSNLGTDAMGNTMSYEPEMIEMEFLDVLPTNTTNIEDEGIILSPKSDPHLFTKYQNIINNEQYSPYSEHRKEDADLDHITAIGADQHAQNAGHIVGVTMSIASNDELEAMAPYSCYTANTHRRSTIDSNINDNHNVSTSSIGIFDWNTPPPLNAIREISLQNLNLNGWIDDSRNTSITRRHTLNVQVNGGMYKRSPIARNKYMNDPQIISKLYGTGTGASINMEHDSNDNESNKDEEKAKHSRHTTATSMTGTFIQPDYPNIITAQNDDEHHNILKTQNLMPIPYNKTTNHLDEKQREIVNIFEQKTKQ